MKKLDTGSNMYRITHLSPMPRVWQRLGVALCGLLGPSHFLLARGLCCYTEYPPQCQPSTRHSISSSQSTATSFHMSHDLLRSRRPPVCEYLDQSSEKLLSHVEHKFVLALNVYFEIRCYVVNRRRWHNQSRRTSRCVSIIRLQYRGRPCEVR